MGNPHRGEASFEVEGKAYRVRYSWNAAAEYEEAAGKPLSDALFDIARERLSARSLRAMLWAGLQEHHQDVTLKDAGRLIDRMGRKEAQRVMGVALRFFFPELEPAETKCPDPPTPAAPAGAAGSA
jgi:hypothetical protein